MILIPSTNMVTPGEPENPISCIQTVFVFSCRIRFWFSK